MRGCCLRLSVRGAPHMMESRRSSIMMSHTSIVLAAVGPTESVGTTNGEIHARAEVLFHAQLGDVFKRRDRLFAWLFVAQWIFAIAGALLWSPWGWAGKVQTTNLHVYYALLFGGALTIPPIVMIRMWPGRVLTRHAVAVAQMLWSALLVHLSGGRIETHFHIFGSLAFLAFYSDWKVLLTASVVVAVEHLVRGMLWSESVYGVVNPEWWRFLELAFWVIFEDIVLVMGVFETLRALRSIARRHAELEVLNRNIEVKVKERTKELSSSREQYRLLVETTKTIPWEMDRSELRFTYVGPQIQSTLNIGPETCLAPGFFLERLHPDDRKQTVEAIRAVGGQAKSDIELRLKHGKGHWIWLRLIWDAAKADGTLRGVMFDVTENRELEIQLRQAQKLESVGRLAAGIAHEINTPVQFVNDSVHFVQDAMTDLAGLIDSYRAVNQSVLDGKPTEDLARAASEAEEESDLVYLLDNVPKALARSIDGLGRVATIVRSMKEFAHPDTKEMMMVDLNQAVSSTLTIAHNEYKYIADIQTDLGDLPPVECHAGEVNQAVLNIIVNASHAIGDIVAGTDRRGLIKVTTRVEKGCAVISIGDTGGGIPEHVRDRIFDPFFTTKEVGRGTGQGLAIARSVIIEKHGGDLTFETEPGKGTTFFIRIPIRSKQHDESEQAA
jgi:two-component system NtrC family sensor kinase